MSPPADERPFTAEELAAGLHRHQVGGLWDEVGHWQFALLRRHGLRPAMKFLDLGCGSLRGGVRFIEYLDPGNYFGIDRSAALLAAGYDHELAACGLQSRLPRASLLCDDSFAACRFGVEFDFALAQSLFTHLPSSAIRHCLAEVAAAMAVGAPFFATYFECPESHPEGEPLLHQPGGITSFPDRDPYHYRVRELAACARGLPWRLVPLGAWGHPRDQRVACFVRRVV